jgi:hypothetical protein
MQAKFTEITYDVQLQAGESLSVPKEIAEIVGPGHWVVSIRSAESESRPGAIRDHAAFLNSFAPEDEGLYDDYSAR